MRARILVVLLTTWAVVSQPAPRAQEPASAPAVRNAVYLLSATFEPARKSTLRWLTWAEDLMVTYAFFV
jgi:hypothetical protein